MPNRSRLVFMLSSVLVLAAGGAIADEPTTEVERPVSIVVQQTPLSISVSGVTPALSVLESEDLGQGTFADDEFVLTYNSGPDGAASITVGLKSVEKHMGGGTFEASTWNEELGDLILTVNAVSVTAGTGDQLGNFSRSSTLGGAADLVNDIPVGTGGTAQVRFRLGGEAPSTPTWARVNLEFAIQQAAE